MDVASGHLVAAHSFKMFDVVTSTAILALFNFFIVTGLGRALIDVSLTLVDPRGSGSDNHSSQMSSVSTPFFACL
jgi:hypothetical protein